MRPVIGGVKLPKDLVVKKNMRERSCEIKLLGNNLRVRPLAKNMSVKAIIPRELIKRTMIHNYSRR